jgi:hypothetical protein
MSRKLTKFFGSYKLAKYQKDNKLSMLELIDFDDMDINTLIRLIKLGHPDRVTDNGRFSLTDEEACDILDKYIQDNEENNYITAYIDILDELDRDIHLFKGFGVNVEKIKQDLKAKVAQATEVETDDEVDADLGEFEVEI